MSAFEAIDIITKKVTRENLNTEKAQLRYLTYWWSNKYNKPFKDPLLKEYTLEDLYYEYRLHNEFVETSHEKSTEESDKIEEQKENDALAWAEAEEEKERQELETNGSTSSSVKITNEDEEWMKKHMEYAKSVYGDSFGEDITEDFEDD